jgi:phosphatidate cytidylyltransferase
VSNLLQRLLLFFVGIPLVLAMIVFLPQYRHVAAVIFILVFLGGCTIELSSFFKARGIAVKLAPMLLFGVGLPASAYAGASLGGQAPLAAACVAVVLSAGAALIAAFARFAFVTADQMPDVLPKTNALAFTIAYPGLLGAFIVMIASEPRFATESLLAFCILAFSNDSLAWLVGMTLGRRRRIFAASPNKSVAGFIGGALGSVGTAFGCAALFPYAIPGPWWTSLIIGAAVAVAAIVGDLFESALKRSAGIKDSGSAVPGRGGFLDSFDSLLFAAPVFYGLSLLFGYFR